uniref:Uncharacterized protein n=1 Tax=Anguilla anguilla TaxID=7936 RepID=A0A0E9STP5_ANGAN
MKIRQQARQAQLISVRPTDTRPCPTWKVQRCPWQRAQTQSKGRICREGQAGSQKKPANGVTDLHGVILFQSKANRLEASRRNVPLYLVANVSETVGAQ